jgi:hypothetical protein
MSSRRCFEPGSILIFAKVKMAPGQEPPARDEPGQAALGDIHFPCVSLSTFGSDYTESKAPVSV